MSESGPSPDRPVVEPVVTPAPVPRHTPGLAEGQDLFRIGIRARPPWMPQEQSLELRLPEVLRSSAGVHVLDHYLSGLAPLSDPSPLPVWEEDGRTGGLSYRCTLADGVTFAAEVLPGSDTVDLALTVVNGTTSTLTAVESHACLDLRGAPDVGHPGEVDDVFASFGGELRSLADTTPSAAEVQRSPWLLIRTEQGAHAWEGPRTSATWWCTDQVADRALMAARSSSGGQLVGLAWEGTPATLMSNGNNPCLHAGPAVVPALEPGATVTSRGRLYFPASPALDALAARYDADREQWARSAG